uniref:Uncharacterized protein n=1 Tax=Brassica oleracea var. oleracea TaxID=109376 RepID=A0A0D3DM63_BRAOL
MDVDKSVQVVIFIVADLSHAKIVVAIINDFGSTVQFHCKSKDIDLGNQRLQPGGSWSFHFQRNFFGSIDAANKAREVSLTSLPLAAGVVAKLGFANHVVEQGEAWKKAKEIAENIMKNEQGFSDLEDVWDDLPVSRLKYNALDDFQEVFQTTFKSSDEVFSHVSPFHNRSERFGSLPNEVWKSSGRPGSLLTRRLPRRSSGRLLGSRPF